MCNIVVEKSDLCVCVCVFPAHMCAPVMRSFLADLSACRPPGEALETGRRGPG